MPHRIVLRLQHELKFAEGVVLTISSEGVRTIEGLTGVRPRQPRWLNTIASPFETHSSLSPLQEVVSAVLISDISFCTTSGAKKEVFAFISKDDRLKRRTCHLYECLDVRVSGLSCTLSCIVTAHYALSQAHKLTQAIGQAFTAAQEEALARKGNPFAPTSKERDSEWAAGGTCQDRVLALPKDMVFGCVNHLASCWGYYGVHVPHGVLRVQRSRVRSSATRCTVPRCKPSNPLALGRLARCVADRHGECATVAVPSVLGLGRL